MKKLLLISLMLITFSFAKAQDIPGGFDQTFGDWGFTTQEMNNCAVFNLGKGSVALQSDGKIVTFTEYAPDYGQEKILVMRHNTDGTLDTSYGDNGLLHLAPANGIFYPFDSEIVEDDNLLIVGYTYNSSGGNMFLMKLDSNGSPVSSFGNNGYVTYNKLADWTLVTRSLAVQPDGKIVVSGEYGKDNYSTCLLRLSADGQLDPTFGDNGMFINESYDHLGHLSMSIGESVAIAPDGRIYLCGWRATPDEYWGSTYDSKIVCVDTNGSLVTTFGDNGVKEISFSEIIDEINDCEVMPDGKLVVAGQAEIYVEDPGEGPNYELFVARLNEDGSFDTSFGNDGVTKVQYMENSNHYCHEMTVAEDGQIFIGGYFWDELKDVLITGFNPDGTLNLEFGEQGFTHFSFGGVKTSCITDLAMQPDGKLVAIGHYEHDEAFADYLFCRFHTSLSLDDDVEENTMTEYVSTYPNPAVNEVNFVNLENECVANVYDAMGRLIMSETVSANGKLNVSNLTSGNYFVELINGSQIIKTRFTK
ncbi:MAG: T9SS type A sorting domain-containing protein [Bacteroidia bacterium]|nr:T9SS type A sorting domain-containing protein [Bacteroidia bacterium]